MSKRFLLVLAACIIGLGAVLYLTREKADAPGNSNSVGNSVKPSSHIFGSGNKNVTLIEYGDFQCPACGVYYPIIKELKEKYKDAVSFQFRNFPLSKIHQNAFAAARAGEAAGLQNKFWEMHDLLYEQQKSWSNASDAPVIFEGYARRFGLNIAKFKSDYKSSIINNVINADIKEGYGVGVNATPTFVLDGKRVAQNPTNQQAFDKLIADEIAAKNK